MAIQGPSKSGIVEVDAVYQKAEFLSRVGLGEAAFRSARRAGLKVAYVHGKAYIRGRDWLDYLDGKLSPQGSPRI